MLVQPLAKMINIFFNNGIFLHLLKPAKVVRIYKRVNAFEMTDSSPISLFQIVCKLFENAFLVWLNLLISDFNI